MILILVEKLQHQLRFTVLDDNISFMTTTDVKVPVDFIDIPDDHFAEQLTFIDSVGTFCGKSFLKFKELFKYSYQLLIYLLHLYLAFLEIVYPNLSVNVFL